MTIDIRRPDALESSVLDHRFGQSAPYTLGVEEEYMLLDPQTWDLVQHIDSMGDGRSSAPVTAPPRSRPRPRSRRASAGRAAR